MRKIIISEEIFGKFPEFKRGIIIVKDIENALSNKRIKKPFNKEIEKRMGEECLDHENVRAWDEMHKKFGSNPNKFPPAIKALLKRIQKGGGIPFINSVVALMNFISIKHLVPVGGDDVDTIKGNLCLGLAHGNENFIGLGSQYPESPDEGEVIYFDDKSLNVMCRKLNWRNSDFSKITENTKRIVINIDGIDPISDEIIKHAQDELAKLLIEQCQAKLETNFLNKNNREIEIDL